MPTERTRVCPVEYAPGLDNRWRRWLQNPHTILGPFVKEGMKVLDVGCGPGHFTVEMARTVGAGGRVFAADLQEGMLKKLGDKIRGTDLEQRVTCVQCDTKSINIAETFDFILAFYMVHEVPDKDALFRQLRAILRPEGKFLLVEPKLLHVSRKAWEETKALAAASGFRLGQGPRLLLSWTAVLEPA